MNKTISVLVSAMLALCAYSAVPNTAYAAVEARPSVAIYKPGQKAGVLAISNSDPHPRSFQLHVNEMTVENGIGVSKPSTELRFAPSIITVPAKSVQTVRFVMKGASDSERYFRIIVEELKPIDFKPTESGIYFLTKMSLPWFWRSDSQAPQLSARWDGEDLLVKNSGNSTAQLSVLTAGSVKVPGLVGYVMPGAEERFKIGAKAQVASIALNINGKAATLDVK